MKDKTEKFIKKALRCIPEKKRPALIIISGLILIFIIAVFPSYTVSKDKKETASGDYETKEQAVKDAEERLGEIISLIDGAGKTEIFLTVDSSEENIYAKDINGEKSEYVVIKTNSNESGMLIKAVYPKIRGVAVVCEGGDNPRVKVDITNAVCSSMGISSTRISIAKMKDRSD